MFSNNQVENSDVFSSMHFSKPELFSGAVLKLGAENQQEGQDGWTKLGGDRQEHLQTAQQDIQAPEVSYSHSRGDNSDKFIKLACPESSFVLCMHASFLIL